MFTKLIHHAAPLSALIPLLAFGCVPEAGDGLEEFDEPRSRLCIDDECVDGESDITLAFYINNVDFRSQSFKVGKDVHIWGSEYPCFDSPCSRPSVIVSTRESNKLLAAALGGRVNDTSRFAPLSVNLEGDEVCGRVDAGCEDDTYYQRSTIEVSSNDHDGVSRYLDGTTGWAPGGYHVSTSSWVLSNASCQLSVSNGRVTILRDACDADGDCPEATTVDSCEPREGPYDYLYARLPVEQRGTYEGDCEIIAVNELTVANYETRVDVELDCVFTNPLDPYEW